MKTDLYGLNRLADTSRLNAADYFYVYTRQVLPRMEEKIETILLEKFMERLGTKQEKKEILWAYN